MPVQLTPAKPPQLDLFRDENLTLPVSSMSWEDPIEETVQQLGSRRNLYSGDTELATFKRYLTADPAEVSSDEAWAAGGTQSLRVTNNTGGPLSGITLRPKTQLVNLVPDPSFEGSLSTWITSTPLATPSVLWAAHGTKSFRQTGLLGVSAHAYVETRRPVVAGRTYTVVSTVNVVNNGATGTCLALHWFNQAGTLISSLRSSHVPTMGVFTRSMSGTAPAGAVTCYVRPYEIRGPQGDQIDIYADSMAFGEGITEFFDGDDDDCAWLGQPNNSPSRSPAHTSVAPAVPGHTYTIGITVRNNAPTSRTFRLHATAAGQTWTTEVSIPSGDVHRLVVLSIRIPYPSSLATTYDPNISSYTTHITWTLEAPGTWQDGESFNIDDPVVADGPSSDPAPRTALPNALSYHRGSPVKLWAVNNYASTRTLAVHATAPGPGSHRPWIEVSSDPDTVPWSSARHSTYDLGPVAPGAKRAFWIRPVMDGSVTPGKRRFKLNLIAES